MNTSAPPLVLTRDLTKRYRATVTAVDQVNLTVHRGEVYGFLGPNGAGKTTTLRMLLGLIRTTAGSATVLGHPPGDPRGLRRIGAMVESPALYPYLSGRDNLRVLARYAHIPADRIDDALATVDLTARARDRFADYSLGMKQLDQAARLAADLLRPHRVRHDDGRLRCHTGPQDAARLNRALVLAGVQVSELHSVERDLEDVFLELTGPQANGAKRAETAERKDER